MEGIKDHLFKETLNLLKQPAKSRSPRDLATLMEATSEIDFFKQMHSDYKTDEVHKECLKCMTLEFFRAGTFVFNYGDVGDSFYIILKGRVSCQVPKSRMAIANYDYEERGAVTPKLPVPTSLKPDILVPCQDEAAQESEESELDTLVTVKLKEDGATFGELALLTGQPRSAAVQCTENSWIAKLSRDDFLRILKDHEEKKLTELVAFLKSLKPFQKWTKYSLVKLAYLFETRLFKFNQVVYRCNDPAEQIFIVRSGEFKFSCPVVEDRETQLHLRFKQAVKRTNLQMFIKGPSEIFGEDDIIEKRNRLLTCQCASFVGEVLVMDKLDFVKRLQGVFTEVLSERHQLEEEWKSRRVQKLMTIEVFKKMIAGKDRGDERQESVSTAYGRRRLDRKEKRPASVALGSARAAKLNATTGAGLFKTEIFSIGEALNATIPAIPKLNTYSISPKELRLASELQPLATLTSRSKNSNRPPPNFFASPAEAVIKRYKFRPLITRQAGRRTGQGTTPLNQSLQLTQRETYRKGRHISEGRDTEVLPRDLGV
jgi:CRP-like cAMP-binding protein